MEATHQALLLPFVLLEPHDLALLLLLPLPGLLRVLLHLPDQLDLLLLHGAAGGEKKEFNRE